MLASGGLVVKNVQKVCKRRPGRQPSGHQGLPELSRLKACAGSLAVVIAAIDVAHLQHDLLPTRKPCSMCRSNMVEVKKPWRGASVSTYGPETALQDP